MVGTVTLAYSYPVPAAGEGGARPTHVDELAKLSEIHDKGGLSDAEYERAKEKILH